MADRVTHTKREEGVQGGRAGGGYLEGRGGDNTSTDHGSNNISRRTAQIPGGSRYWDGHPRGQAAPTYCIHEGGSPIRDLPRPDQGI